MSQLVAQAMAATSHGSMYSAHLLSRDGRDWGRDIWMVTLPYPVYKVSATISAAYQSQLPNVVSKKILHLRSQVLQMQARRRRYEKVSCKLPSGRRESLKEPPNDAAGPPEPRSVRPDADGGGST
ncbi:hypothetical protein SETIT_5G276600v2 [Setaria italica]|uniref:Uncharacterized protein n=1 Tax=Setaria italica TaxID=4555 RepID=A0A368R9H0_SETIT|nr:hypothetical protein SETIT_5G276600v2 [Setaria italica]